MDDKLFVYKPRLSNDVIRAMVTAAKTTILSTDESCFLALSTIYGLRRQEMINLQSKDLNLRLNKLYIETHMSGIQRYHLIPPEIKPYLKGHDFNNPYSGRRLNRMFKRILIKSGLSQLNSLKIGWESIRRALLAELLKVNMDMDATRAFLGWKPSEYIDSFLALNSDEKIFQKHPFLAFWENSRS